MDKVRENTLNLRKSNKIEKSKQGQGIFFSYKVIYSKKELKYLIITSQKYPKNLKKMHILKYS